jgi:hypothetical protein
LLPHEPFPPYTFVPGQTPHPLSDSAGHSFGRQAIQPDTIDSENWKRHRAYLFGLDLFNHGYYWEAHESWEAVWNACGRRGPTANFLKGLIQLAAAGVKARETMLAGVRGHGRRAAELFEQVAREVGPRHLGLSLLDLIRFSRTIAEGELPGTPDVTGLAVIVFDFVLIPE